MKRLRMHSIETVDGRLFVQFIALILMSELRRTMRETKLIAALQFENSCSRWTL